MRSILWLCALVCSGYLAATEPVDLNHASAQEIAAVLHGIGVKKAEQIVVYREQYGPIQTPEELLAIKGIGPKTLEKNRARMITGLIQPKPGIKAALPLDGRSLNH